MASSIRRLVWPEEEVVLEEVAVAVHVGHHELLIGELGVALEQVGVAGVRVDDELVDLLRARRCGDFESCSYSMPQRQCG
jgi:hypothetical protein